jgi:hypothetical protein
MFIDSKSVQSSHGTTAELQPLTKWLGSVLLWLHKKDDNSLGPNSGGLSTFYPP